MKLYVYAGIFFAVLAFAYWYSERQYDLGVYETTARYETSLRESQNEQTSLANELQKSNSLVAELLLTKEPEIEIRYETIEKEVVKYITSNESCNLTNGAAILLNESAKAQRLPKSLDTALTEAQKHAPSPVTQLETVETCIKWAEQYYKLARRHDALINTLD